MKVVSNLVAKLSFWWASKTLIEGKNFSVDNTGIITILKGRFEGVQFRYDNLRLKEEEENHLDFNTVIVNPSTECELDYVTNEQFIKLSSNILRVIFHNLMKTSDEENKGLPIESDLQYSPYDYPDMIYNEKSETLNEDRNYNTPEFIDERDFYEKVDPVLEKRVSKRKPGKKAIRSNSGSHSKIQQSSNQKRPSSRTPRKKRPV